MDQDKIKEAFQKVKQDIDDLKYNISIISSDLQDIKQALFTLTNTQTIRQTNQQTDTQHIPSINQNTPTDRLNEPYNYPLEALKDPNTRFSTGNGGVPTNRQT